MKLKDFILNTKLTDNLKRKEDAVFSETCDKIFLTSFHDKKKLSQTSVTDYAIANNACPSKDGNISYMLRTKSNGCCIYAVKRDGKREGEEALSTTVGIRPEINFDMDIIYKLHIDIDEDKQGRRILKFGSFPKSKAYDSEALEERFKTDRELFNETGRAYSGFYDEKTDSLVKNKEYVYEGKTYARVKVKRNKKASFNDKTPVGENGSYVWINVEPISWIVTNWDDVDNGKAKAINAIAEEVIMCGIPFNKVKLDWARYFKDEKHKSSLWQNSTVRGFLNGINVDNIKENGNIEYALEGGGDFSTGGFLDEAFDIDINKTIEFEEEYDY